MEIQLAAYKSICGQVIQSGASRSKAYGHSELVDGADGGVEVGRHGRRQPEPPRDEVRDEGGFFYI